MGYKEKYEQALERAKKLQANAKGLILNKWLYNVFPELKENEDDRIRNNAIQIISSLMNGVDVALPLNIYKECIAWLEKQGEQKPIWSEEDERLLKLSLENLAELKNRFGEKYGRAGECICWLKSIKERMKGK